MEIMYPGCDAEVAPQISGRATTPVRCSIIRLSSAAPVDVAACLRRLSQQGIRSDYEVLTGAQGAAARKR